MQHAATFEVRLAIRCRERHAQVWSRY